MLATLLTAGTFFSTLLGGLFALRFRGRLHLLLGFTAGFLLGIVGFELLPGMIAQINEHRLSPTESMVALVAAFLLFHILEKSVLIHHTHEGQYAEHHHPQVGVLSALALVGHSFMDGVGIGLGFQVSHSVGVMVASAVISHDFTDGMNTISVMTAHQNSRRTTLVFLALDAAAPLLGLLVASVIAFSPRFLALYLGAFAGFLLYIGASDILPEAHSRQSSAPTVAMTVAGAALAFAVSRFV